MDDDIGSANDEQEFEKVGERVSIFLRGDRWYVNYQQGRRQVRKSLKTKAKKEARRRALAIERELVAGNLQAGARPPLIKDATAAFRETKQAEGLAPSTLKKYDYCFRKTNEVADELDIRLISEIDARFMDLFRKRRTEELAKRPGRDGQNTAMKDLVTIREVVSFALERRMIEKDPLASYSIAKVAPKPQPYWVQQDLERILAAVTRQPHQDVYRLLAWTGMRIGEAEHLTWNDVDFDNRIIKIQAKPGWKPKTGDSRAIPMSTEVFELLSRQPRRCQWAFSFPVCGRWPVRQVRQRRLLDYLKKKLKELGLPGHLHTFRHTFISLALTRGVPESIVRSWVGHVDERIIRRYTHIASRQSQDAMRGLEESVQARRTRS